MARHWELGLAIVCCIVFLAFVSDAVDCRRFVFAPMCRGISAKRSVSSSDSRDLQRDDLADRSEDDWVELKKTSRDMYQGLPLKHAIEAKQIFHEILQKYKELLRLTSDEEK